MFSPKLYEVRSFTIKELIESNYELNIPERTHCIKQSDNQLFRLVRNATQDNSAYNPYIVFVDCKGCSKVEDALSHLLFTGLVINGVLFKMCERSASMTRQGILSMIDSRIHDIIDEAITMEIPNTPQVLSKYYAYRGLMFSSCHCLDGWLPKIIIVPDCKKVMKDQKIKYIYDAGMTLTKPDGTEFEWQQKDAAEDIRDIEIDIFDGCGIHHPDITKEMMNIVGSKTPMTSIILRAPYIKGCSHEMDYEKFLSERGVEYIQDIWGKWHSVHDKMFILTKSMYKGFKYFKNDGTYADWDKYWDLFHKYGHCIGVAKWNFSFDEEPIYTRANYQILQDLDLPYDKFRHLADYSIEWACKIIDGDPLYTYAFLGLTADKHSALNCYTKAVMKNPLMLHEPTVRSYFVSLLKKTIDEMKCGKLWLKASFKFLAPDLIMLMEHIGGLELNGCLESNEFYSSGDYRGEYLVERNPHISKSEHVPLTFKTNDVINEYCSHLANVCMINCRSITPQRLNGADFDGDLVLLTNDEVMLAGVDKNNSAIIDVDDKITGAEEIDCPENKLVNMLRTLKSFIGEYSNYASAYHNKCPRTKDIADKYDKYISVISVLTGKSIDYAKTGVIYHMPRHIAKYGRPLPWFMRYRSEYYKRQELSRAPSNMNKLCWDIEHWERGIKWKKSYKDFDYRIMMDESVSWSDDIYENVEKIYNDFCKEMIELSTEQSRIRKYEDDDVKDAMSKNDAQNFVIDYAPAFDKYKKLSADACPDVKMLANIAVDLCYRKYPSRSKKYMWICAEKGILDNIDEDFDMMLPVRDDAGDLEYLGRKYRMEYKNRIEDLEDFLNWEEIA